MTDKEYDFPEEGIQDVADQFDELAKNQTGIGARNDASALLKLARLSKSHNIEPDNRVDFIMAGYERFIQREVMNGKSELREALEQMEALFNE